MPLPATESSNDAPPSAEALELARALVERYYANSPLFRYTKNGIHTRADIYAVVTHFRENGGHAAWHEVQRLPNAYPVLKTDAAQKARLLRQAHGDLENLDLVGRAATFQYLHIHDLIDSALGCVQSIASSMRGSPQPGGAAGHPAI